jgi:hypothetical protein
MHDAVERWKTSGFVFHLPCKSISLIDAMILGWMGGTGGESAIFRFWFRGLSVGLYQKCSLATLLSL